MCYLIDINTLTNKDQEKDGKTHYKSIAWMSYFYNSPHHDQVSSVSRNRKMSKPSKENIANY